MKFTKGFWTKMVPLFVLVFITIILSVGVYFNMMEAEKENCWDRLEIATKSTADKIQVRLNDNINFLDAVADSYILTDNIGDIEGVGEYLNSVMEMTIFDRIDVLRPDNTLITQQGEIVDRGGTKTYEQLVAKGKHISQRTTSSFTGREVICCIVPIKDDGEVIALLIGTLDCGTLGEIFEVLTYKGNAQIFLIDCTDGSYIIDNWHSELGNIYDLGERKSVDTGEMIDMSTSIINREEVRFAFYSNTNSEKSYQYCVPIEGYNWELCVGVQEDIVFAHANDLRDMLFTVAIIEIILVIVYMAWNMWLTVVVANSEEKAKNLEFERIKNDARTKFISNMSHDVRTPLNGIVGMLQIIRNHRDDEKKVDECLRKIEISTQYLSTLASDMLDINEIENNKLVLQEEPIDITKLADELTVMVEQRAHDAGVEYCMDCSAIELPYALGSDIHIKRILVNLIGNSIKYSKDAGKKVWVTITDEAMQFDKLRRMYHFVIKDNGIGMTEEFQKNMYNAFEQESVSARSDYQGYGLGLTIVNHLVKKMDGDIKLDSVKGEGSTFTVSIPLKIDNRRDIQEQVNDISVDLTGLNILLVEDNEFNMEIAEILLTDAGATVDKATDGKIATEMFEKSNLNTYDLILMDIMMPVMDGCEATRVIRAKDRQDAKKIPIIAMTANTFAEEVQRCLDSGMNAHLSKPLDVNRLMTKIMGVCKKSIDKKD